MTDCPKLGHSCPLFKINSPSSSYLFICSYKNQPNLNLAGELCRGWRFFISPQMPLCKLCDGVKGPTICKINFSAFHTHLPVNPADCVKSSTSTFIAYSVFQQPHGPNVQFYRNTLFCDVTKGAYTPHRCSIYPLSSPCICPLPHMAKVQ